MVVNRFLCKDITPVYKHEQLLAPKMKRDWLNELYIYTVEEYIAIKNLQNRNRLPDIENKLMVTKGVTWGRDEFGVWD